MKKIRRNTDWEYNEQTKRFLNPTTNKWVKNPRSSSIGKSKGTNKLKNAKADKPLFVHLNIDVLNIVNYQFENSRGYKRELVVYFLYLLSLKYENYTYIMNNKASKEEIAERFITDYGEQRGVYFSWKELKDFFGADIKHVKTDLVRYKLISIQERKVRELINGNYLTRTIFHYVPLYKREDLVTIELNKNEALKRINKLKFKSNLQFERFVKNTKIFFTHPNPKLNEMIQNDEYYFMDDFSGRFYSPISFMRKEQRREIRVKQMGVPDGINEMMSCETDMKNSNPLCFFVYLKNQEFFNQELNINFNKVNATQELKDELNELAIEARKGKFYELLEMKFDVNKIDHINKLADDYSLLKKRKLEERKEYETPRDKAKALSNYIFFGSFDTPAGKYVFDMLLHVYPCFANLLAQMKRIKMTNKVNKIYKNVAYLLQSVELYIVNEICSLCTFPVTTVHDSFICECRHKAELKSIINNVFDKHFFKVELETKEKTKEELIEEWLVRETGNKYINLSA
jgi:hypothetical protein